ncbi:MULTISPECIES: hypothetical protein [unclassified Sinorhizobium]|uniref:hypothetical protein n=1 Tax=unclassified Sinorhizobium TaxID=2613772 RepID=UPI0035249D23
MGTFAMSVSKNPNIAPQKTIDVTERPVTTLSIPAPAIRWLHHPQALQPNDS